MIDIHNHILFGVDDGSSTIEQSIMMLKEAEKDGITEIILTPHYIKNGPFKLKKQELLDKYQLLLKKCREEELQIKIHLGNELMIHPELPDMIDEGKVCSLADSMYVLVEFPFDKYRMEYDEILYDLRCLGKCIIIAHPERYRYVQDDPNFCIRWLKEGDLLQCNATSLVSHEKLLYQMIDAHFVSFIASDAHNQSRPLKLYEAYSKIENKYGKLTASLLFRENPKMLLENNQIVNENYTKIEEKRRIFAKLFG